MNQKQNKYFAVHLLWMPLLLITLMVARGDALKASVLEIAPNKGIVKWTFYDSPLYLNPGTIIIASSIKCEDPADTLPQRFSLSCPFTKTVGAVMTCPKGYEPFKQASDHPSNKFMKAGWYCIRPGATKSLGIKLDTSNTGIISYYMNVPAATPASPEPAAPPPTPSPVPAPTPSPTPTPVPSQTNTPGTTTTPLQGPETAPSPILNPQNPETAPSPILNPENPEAAPSPILNPDPGTITNETPSPEQTKNPELAKTGSTTDLTNQQPAAKLSKEEILNNLRLKRPQRPKVKEVIPRLPSEWEDIGEKTKNYDLIVKLVTAMVEKGNFSMPSNGKFQATKKTGSLFAYQMALTVAGESCQKEASESLKNACAKKLVDLGWIESYKQHAVNKTEYYDLLAKAANLPEAQNEYVNLCKDVPAEDSRYGIFATAAEHGILKRYKFKGEKGYCLPDKPLSRQQAAEMAATLLQ